MSLIPIKPIYDPDRNNTVWNLNDIYTGEPGHTGRRVPNVDDIAYSFVTGWWRCVSVDSQTMLSVWTPWSFVNTVNETNTSDVLIGGNATISEYFRIYVNTKVVPYEFSIDTRLKIYGANASYIKIFKSDDLKESTISAVINSAGAVVSENINLENVIIPNTTVKSIWVPKQGNLTEKLEDGDVVNAVVYSNSGQVLAIFKLLAVNTNMVRTIDMSKKLITDIDLISPYFSAVDNRLLEYPSNMTVQTDSLIARVTYNDGTQQRYPVDGNKFELHGADNYVVSQMGQTVPVVLVYKLSKSEYSNNIKQVGDERFISKSYSIKTIDSDNMFSVKLFVVPFYSRSKSSWSLEYFMYNLERDTIYRVTPYIEYASNSARFDGTSAKWGASQKLTVAVNLDKVANTFKYYRHVTSFIITLHQAGDNITRTGYYTIEYDTDSVVTHATVAMVQDQGKVRIVDISNSKTDVDAWLRDVYYACDPLYFPHSESKAPRPTHVKVIIGNDWSREIPVHEILNPIEEVNAPITRGDTIRLEFVSNYSSKRLELGTVGMIAMYEN